MSTYPSVHIKLDPTQTINFKKKCNRIEKLLNFNKSVIIFYIDIYFNVSTSELAILQTKI